MAKLVQWGQIFGNRRALGAAAAILFIGWAIMTWVAVGTTQELGASLARIASTNRLLDDISSVESSVGYLHNAERSFSLTGDASYLRRSDEDSREVDRLLTRMPALVDGKAVQQRNIRRLAELAHARIEFSRRIVETRQREGYDAARGLVTSGAGKRINDSLRALIAAMRQIELADLKHEEDHARECREIANITTVAALFMIGGAIIIILVLARSWYLAAAGLRVSEASYRALFDASPNPLWVTNPENDQILLINPAALRMYGYAREEITQVRASELSRPMDTPPDQATKIGPDLVRQRTRKGEELILSTTSRPIDFAGAEAQLFIGVDMTEREAAIAGLRRSEARFQQVFDLQFQLMALLQPSGAILQVNELMASASGEDAGQMAGRKLQRLRMWQWGGAPTDAADLAREIEQITDEPSIFKLFYRSVAAELRVLEASLQPVMKGGEIDYLIFQAHDITERARTLEALHRSEQRLSAAQERASLGSWEIDLVSGDIWWSAKMRKIFNFTDEEPPFDLTLMPRLATEEDRPRVADFLERLQDVIGSASLRFQRSPDRGGDCHLEMVAECIFDAEGEPVKLVGTVMDVTDRISIERQLIRSQRLEAIGKLTGGVAHDFNNMLTIIIGNIEMILETLDVSDEMHRTAELTLQAALRCADLTLQLLAVARRQPLHPSIVDPSQLVRDMATLLRKTLTSEIDLVMSVESNVWKVSVDRAQLESAILNLAINARDAMSDGGKLTIEISNAILDTYFAGAYDGAEPGQYALITVSDTGHGMSPDIIDHAFEPFFTTKTGGNNSGLGLSMVHGFIKQSGGQVSIYSEPGLGTAVKIYLPRASTEGVEAIPESKTELLRGSERVLIVEDDDLVRHHVVKQFQRLGYTAVAAHDGRAALELLANDQAFDLLFTDVQMPGGINGPQLAEAATKAVPGLPVLFTSGYTENGIMHKGHIDPGTHFLSKPYTIGTLAQKVRLVIDRSAQRGIDANLHSGR
jgi:PAS domain S-box-containing protein